MSNAEKMVSVPREWLQGLILAGAGETVCLHDLEIASQALSEQHHSETIGRLMRDKNERIVIVPIGDPHITDGMLVYTHADAGEVERLRDRLKIMTRFRDDFEGKAERAEQENEKLRTELVDAIHSLKTISDLAGRDEFMQDMVDVRGYAKSRSSAANYILSAGAEPSAPKCKTCSGTGMVDDGEITCSEGGIPYENGPVKCVKDCPDFAPVERDERAEFEKVFSEKMNTLPLLKGASLLRYDGGMYVCDSALLAEIFWMARAALERKP